MIKFYNTLTRKKEEFRPLKDNEVGIYTCGPTVYDYAHLGNLRTYIFSDVLRRTLELAGLKVKQVMNITDVGHLTSDEDTGEDKIEKGARREKKTPQEIADFYTRVFLSDLKKLNIKVPKLLPKATDHIKEMIVMIEKIEKNGYAYQTRDGVYFDTAKLKNYGQLSRQKMDLERRARVKKIKGKKSPHDFALWLKAVGKHQNHLLVWDSPWGRGFPGWHIECSAMSEKYLGSEFDIHTGGVDHIPIHHENEIAQSAAANSKIPAKFWLHSEFLLMDKEKMAKSQGNFLTLPHLEEKGFDPLDYRFLVLTNHYRSPMLFDWQKMEEAEKAFDFLKNSIERIKTRTTKKRKLPIHFRENLKNIKKEIKKYFFDDLNISLVLNKLFILAHYINDPAKYFSPDDKEKIISVYEEADRILGLKLIDKSVVPERIEIFAKERQKARLEHNFKKSDIIRKKIEESGYIIEDLKNNKYRIIKK